MNEIKNMCKVNLIKKNGNGKNGEGVWAEFCSEADKLIHDDETLKGKKFNVLIRNQPVTTNKINFGDIVSVVNMGTFRAVLNEPV